MNENKINELVGFDKKFIEIAEWRTNLFGGLVWCRFTVKGEAYRIRVTETGGFLFDFDAVDETSEAVDPDSDRDYMHEKYEGNVSRETPEAVEAEAVTEA